MGSSSEYLLNVYLYFSDNDRRRVSLKYTVGKSIVSTAESLRKQIVKVLKEKREHRDKIFITKVNYSVLALSLEESYYKIANWLDDATTVNFDEIFCEIGRG